MAQHGTSYYLANRFFPAEVKKDVFALYAFVRIPDDIVDDPDADPVVARKMLERYQEMFDAIYAGENMLKTKNKVWQEVIGATVEIFHRYEIPASWAHDFIDAMRLDLEKKVYRTYEELQQYMYGSAEVVGLMMCKIIWYDKDQEAEVFRTAKLLGEAMQYTNFLRDIREDLIDFDRLYIPEDRLLKHNLNHVLLTQYIQGKPIDDAWKQFLSDQILACKEVYREANTGIYLLNKRGRKAVRVASWVYESILDKIVRLEYDVFTHDAHTTKSEKLFTLFSKTLKHAMGNLD